MPNRTHARLKGEVGSRRGTLPSFSESPLPNRTCTFPRIRLSSVPFTVDPLQFEAEPAATLMDRVFALGFVHLAPPPLDSALEHLPHFAMCPAFLDSDSYWGSVAIGLAPP